MNEQNEQNEQNENAAKKAAKEAAQKAKSKIIQKVVSIILPYAITFILILLAGAILLGVFNAVGEKVQELIDGVIDFFTIEYDGAIDVSDEQVDTIINTIADMGVSLDGLKLMGDVDYSNPDIEEANRKAMREYIKKFYQAQIVTEVLNTKPGWFESWTKGDKVYGNVYVYRTRDGAEKSTDSYQLDYLNETDFENKVNSKAYDINKYFTMDKDDNLVFATISTVNGERAVSTSHINYKNVISLYTTPMNFFLYLAMVTENPEFVSKVADLVMKSEIDITIMDNKRTSTTTETNTYTPVSRTATEEENNRRSTKHACSRRSNKRKTSN